MEEGKRRRARDDATAPTERPTTVQSDGMDGQRATTAATMNTTTTMPTLPAIFAAQAHRQPQPLAIQTFSIADPIDLDPSQPTIMDTDVGAFVPPQLPLALQTPSRHRSAP